MQNLEKLYNSGFFSKRARYHWRAPIVCNSIAAWFELQGRALTSAIDVGCATGDLVRGFEELELRATGFEGSPAAEPYIVCKSKNWNCVDMRFPFEATWERFDVCTCFEVVEHIEEEYADQLLDNLVALSDILIISAARPHPTKAPTRYHPNEQEPEYWVERFAARSYAADWEMFQFFREAWGPWRRSYGVKAFWENLLCFRRTA